MTDSQSIPLDAAVKMARSFADGQGHLTFERFFAGLKKRFELPPERASAVFRQLRDAGELEWLDSSTMKVNGVKIAPPRATPREASSWDETFMKMAAVVADRSKDPATQVGACIVSAENRILSLGYNGTPNGWEDDKFPWDKGAKDDLETKHPYVIHAERNAVLNYGGLHSQLKGSKLFVTHFPCNECAKELAQVGVAEVVYLNGYDPEEFSIRASMRIFEACGIAVRQLHLF